MRRATLCAVALVSVVAFWANHERAVAIGHGGGAVGNPKPCDSIYGEGISIRDGAKEEDCGTAFLDRIPVFLAKWRVLKRDADSKRCSRSDDAEFLRRLSGSISQITGKRQALQPDSDVGNDIVSWRSAEVGQDSLYSWSSSLEIDNAAFGEIDVGTQLPFTVGSDQLKRLLGAVVCLSSRSYSIDRRREHAPSGFQSVSNEIDSNASSGGGHPCRYHRHEGPLCHIPLGFKVALFAPLLAIGLGLAWWGISRPSSNFRQDMAGLSAFLCGCLLAALSVALLGS